jgi:hypothetical protein
MSIQAYTNDIEGLLTDSSIINYFTSTNKNIVHFVKTYIEVDKILGASSSNSNMLYNKLDEIKTILSHQSNQLVNLSSSNTLLQSKLETLKDTTNVELKNIFMEFQKEISKHNNTDEIKCIFENFKDRIEIINTQKLNDIDRKNLEVFTSLQTTFEKSLDSHQINNKINSIETTLSSINENFSNNSSKKGQVAETVLLNILTETFPDTEILDTSHNANSGDIQMIKENKPVILIDSKNFGSKTVPKRDLDKFYTDIQQNNCSGILCNAFGGIANKQHFEIDIVDKNILVFVHSHQFDSNVFRLATNIIYNMHQELKDKQSDSIVLDQRLYQNIKIEYNYYIQTFRHHLDIIKSNVNSLSQLSFTLLDNFFKRKATNVELKQFSCHICSAQLSTEKILKTHLKKQHPNVLPPPNTTPLISSVVSKPRGRPKKAKLEENIESETIETGTNENYRNENYNYNEKSRSENSSVNSENTQSDMDE